MKKLINLQMFADDPATDSNASAPGTVEKQDEGKATADTGKEATKTEAKYTDADLDRIIDEKFAKWKKQEEKNVEEAKKLAEMNATQKAEYERDKLQKELDELKHKDAIAEMTKVARKMLSEKDINIPDELLSMMVTTDAKETKTAIDGFAKLYKDAVEAAVKARLRGETPRVGTGSATPVSEIQKRINKYV